MASSMRKQDGNGKGKRADLGLRGQRAAAAAQPMDFEDAVAWLKEVKKELQDGSKYGKFVKAMQDRKAQRLRIDDLITVVEKLFKPRHSHLVAGFHFFFVPSGSAGRKQIHHRKDDVRVPMVTGGLKNSQDSKEGDQYQHNNFAEVNSERVLPENAIWIRQMPASQACKEKMKGNGSGLVEHLEKCLHRCDLCAHVKELKFNCGKTQELAAYQKRAKENLEKIYGEILGQGEPLRASPPCL